MQYNTLQKTKILDLFKSNPNKQYSADEVFDIIGSEVCGKSTVYRLLTRMSEDGYLRKYTMEGSKKSVYQFLNSHCVSHIHLRCVKCGVVLHLDDVFTKDIQNKIFKSKKFTIDESLTVLPGECLACSNFK